MDPFSPFMVTGLNPAQAPATAASYSGQTALATSRGPSAAFDSPPYHPDHPLFWVAGIVLVTVGLIGANSAVRIGKFKASVNAGTT